MDAVSWASQFLDELSRVDALAIRDQQALDSVQRWIGDPIEDYRRAAFNAAENASSDSPERLLALAAFFSGGNISSPDLEPVEPPPNAAGKLAATAILGGIFRNGPDPARIERALQMGEERAC